MKSSVKSRTQRNAQKIHRKKLSVHKSLEITPKLKPKMLDFAIKTTNQNKTIQSKYLNHNRPLREFKFSDLTSQMSNNITELAHKMDELIAQIPEKAFEKGSIFQTKPKTNHFEEMNFFFQDPKHKINELLLQDNDNHIQRKRGAKKADLIKLFKDRKKFIVEDGN